MRRARIGTIVAAALGVAGAALVGWGARGLSADAATRASFSALEERTSASAGEQVGDAAGGRDWAALLAEQPECCAWLEVGGTTIDVPVMRATAEDPERWLYRGLDGAYSDVGTPYLDWRCSPDGRAMVVYGHRTLYESYLFHDLSGAFEQGAFDALGEASWETPAAGATAFEPLCSASVGMSDGRWQRYAFSGAAEMREWLAWAVARSSARAEGAEGLAAAAERCLVLVTCNGRPLYPETRTVTVFVTGEPPP